jgi:hypothetical protein
VVGVAGVVKQQEYAALGLPKLVHPPRETSSRSG